MAVVSPPKFRGLFVTGTDTGVGKTHITAALATRFARMGYRVGVYKPVCSGAVIDSSGATVWEDVVRLSASVGNRFPTERICPRQFAAPLAPPCAAAIEGVHLSLDDMLSGLDWWHDQVDLLLVEGVGGWQCPLTATHTIRDFAKEVGFPVLLVARQQLGTISHTLLTLESIKAVDLPVLGVALNQVSALPDASINWNAKAIRVYGGDPMVWNIPFDSGHQLHDEPTLISMSERLYEQLS